MATKTHIGTRYEGMELKQVIKEMSIEGSLHIASKTKALYASNKSSLTDREIFEIETHMQDCEACRSEIEKAVGHYKIR